VSAASRRRTLYASAWLAWREKRAVIIARDRTGQ
jgi:hypothetical protein